jgi:hypothetical protein
MDRAIVLSVLLLVGLTWLLYKLTVLLEPRAENPPAAPKDLDTNVQSPPTGNGNSSQRLIHQRLRK